MDVSERDLPDSTRESAHKAFRRAVSIAGGQTAFAAIVQKSQQYVSKLLHNRRVMPGDWVEPVERTTGVPKWQTRPDLYPRDEQHSPAPAAGEASPAVDCPFAGDTAKLGTH